MFLWTCADMTPHPLVINYSWWQDRKIFGKDFTLAWGLSKTKIRIFRSRKKKPIVFFFGFAAAPFTFWPKVWEHYQNTWKQVHSCRWDKSTSSYFSDSVMLRAPDIQTFFLLCHGQPLWITQFRLTFMHRPLNRPIFLPAKYFLPIGFGLVCWYITACFHET